MDSRIKEVSNMAIDPICKKGVGTNTAWDKVTYKGKTYYFCCAGCKGPFEEDPEKYREEVEGDEENYHGD